MSGAYFLGFASLREAMASARLVEEIGATARTENAAEHFQDGHGYSMAHITSNYQNIIGM